MSSGTNNIKMTFQIEKKVIERNIYFWSVKNKSVFKTILKFFIYNFKFEDIWSKTKRKDQKNNNNKIQGQTHISLSFVHCTAKMKTKLIDIHHPDSLGSSVSNIYSSISNKYNFRVRKLKTGLH